MQLPGHAPQRGCQLEKRDIDFSAGLISLRETKSQEDQVLPLLSVALRRWPSIWDRRLRQPRAANPGASGEQPAPCLALLRSGVTWPPRLPAAPVSSYLTFSPSHPRLAPPPNSENLGRSGGGALCLCGPIRKVAPTRELPGALLCGVRTFLWRSKNASSHPACLGNIIISQNAKHRTRNPSPAMGEG